MPICLCRDTSSVSKRSNPPGDPLLFCSATTASVTFQWGTGWLHGGGGGGGGKGKRLEA